MNAFASGEKPGRRQSGYSLVEVLVAVVMLSIGLLGLAGLQLNSVQNTNSATQRFEATTLAYDILERMRGNRVRAIAGAYDIALGEAPAGADVAATDLAAWKDALAALPAGDGAVAIDGGQVTITVAWSDAVDDDQDGNHTAQVHLRTEL
jgi:type IV pilus assembly protein PilV